MALYESSDSALWEAALDEYPARLQGLGKERLVDLDDFYRVELVKTLKERGNAGYVTKDELVKIVDWKLTRGKWRPRLLGYAKDAAETDIIETSKRAFAALPDVQSAIKILSELKGIGPATASAVLAAHSPNLAPFMSDEALAAALKGTKDYTPKKYAELAEALTAKAKDLGCKSTGEPWTPSDVERAIWSDDAKGRQKGVSKTASKAAPKGAAKGDAKSQRGKGSGGATDAKAAGLPAAKGPEKDTTSGSAAADLTKGSSKRKAVSRERLARNVKSKS
ncbi:Hypothetical protein KFL_004300060 [Klebsormidium nitens]|uniref:Uncharacterized protein n=1 Tax=Klebsormidium nitens TaxID=105231 RepID=A0A1Y1IBX0_KLENI|nr:Hypothetical protein KFL_004300060 [Klebsormidium nitens]|eukprot:GAQ88455.1 Hypothetical protein KFL_004300060 [Klebsormidium nitens]